MLKSCWIILNPNVRITISLFFFKVKSPSMPIFLWLDHDPMFWCLKSTAWGVSGQSLGIRSLGSSLVFHFVPKKKPELRINPSFETNSFDLIWILLLKFASRHIHLWHPSLRCPFVALVVKLSRKINPFPCLIVQSYCIVCWLHPISLDGLTVASTFILPLN